ncbi:hypothetical protein D2V93_17835 [Flagellimonas taeanensis]|uniref:nucleoside 2-deoxyribosyltransferase n=1 Tax=Flavobacteriaceae TaxID=49546 RepID=UPI000E679C16|nr:MULTISPECIES: nucleoside 2-deoxyribosyltransferase [Allomuricauda]MDC6386298.1 nucleoside 2-deoxyribosyltransferase [Muricauda sp. SK9]RIV48026.1 hypothetical protein D2V93_17835 [Allomuricauda taeanensis]
MSQKICVLGDIVTDITLPQDGNDTKLRLGGIIHCVRSLWALDLKYDVKFAAPAYLSDSILKYCSHHGVVKADQIGVVKGSPYNFLIGSVKETGNQNYNFILKDEVKIDYIPDELDSLNNGYDDILLVSGNFEIDLILEKIDTSPSIHIDLSNNIENFSKLKSICCQTIFLSTSSSLFLENFKDFKDFSKRFEKHCKVLVLKENRGGSRIYDFENSEVYQIPAITQPIVHSVGVGDVFDACFVAKYRELGIEKASYLASWVASEYAITTYPDDFKNGVKRVLGTNIDDIVTMGGCVLPWEKRALLDIYIAAPDFDYIDTSKIDLLVECLKYHNFNPRRPVKENGQLSIADDKQKRRHIYSKDISLLNKCKLLIAVYLNDDPGTMIELGYAKAKGIPCLVFDPFNKAYNCMLTEMPNTVSSELDVIISEVFNCLSKVNA